MARCPFCKGAVTEDLIRFGGNCPKCLIEIPGEESPTDPGEHARAIQEVEEQASRGGKGVLIAVALLGLASVTAGGWWASRARSQVADNASASNSFYVVPLSEHKDLDYGAAQDEGAQSPSRQSARHRLGRTASQEDSRRGGVAKRLSPQTGGSVAERAEPQPAEGRVLGSASSLTDPLAAFSGPSIGPADKGPHGIVLSDPNQIRAMVGAVLERGARQLNQCYERRLKQRQDLAGSWVVDFTVGTDGVPRDVRIRPEDTADRTFETCMQRNIEEWHFQAVAEEQQVTKTYTFRPDF